MQFLFPNVLWGLIAAIGIPLIIHLFNFRKTKKVLFSNVHLLKSIETQSSSFRKLKNWLIMAARMLFLAFLIIAFAQPTYFNSKKDINAVPQGINGVYLDNSLSMQNTVNSKRFIDLAVIKIDELLSIFYKSPNVQLSTNDFDGQDNFVLNASKIKDKLTSIDFSESPRTLEQVYNRQKNIASKYMANAENHFFWFSDFQKSTIGNIQNVKIATNDQIHLIPINGESSHNVFVDSVWLNTPIVREMQNNQIEARIYNSGNKKVTQLSVKLFIDGAQTSTATIDINPNSFTKASFNFTVKSRGTHKAKISFDDQPITFDNEYFLLLNASPNINILHLTNGASQSYVSKMYANDSLFKYSAFPFNNIDPNKFQNADFVVLESVAKIEGETKNKLTEFVKSGGNLLLIPSESVDPESIKSFVGSFGIHGLSTQSSSDLIEIKEPDKASPFFSDVFESVAFNNTTGLPKANAELRWGGAIERILSLKNGQNFLTRTHVGSGNLYLMASPLNKTFGNFAEHAYFVPTFFKMATMSSKSEKIAYNFSESTLSFEMPQAEKNATYKLKSGKFEIIPIQKIVGKTLFLELPKASELNEGQILSSGYYDLMMNGKVEKTIAINHDEKESKIDTYSSQELKELLKSNKNIQVYDSVKDGAFIDAFKDMSLGTPLWKYFVYLALAALLAEILISRFMKS